MRVFTILVGMRLTVLMRLFFRNGITLYPVYLLRFLVMFQNALFSSVLALAERKNYGRKIKATEITSPPVFIIGHWRTGTTYLHQLIAKDKQFTAPALVHTVIPDHFLFSTRYYLPIMRLTTPRTRPMDNVRMEALEPQEDEFALVKMGSDSPLVKMLFPRGREFFLRDYDQFIPEGEKLETWKKNLLTFYRKLTLLEGKPIVSKNPYHTMRISLLAAMFPGARFIHIHRDPLVVVPSTIHMWNITARGNKMKRGWVSPSIEDASETYGSFLEYVADQRSKLDPGQFTEVAFEDLEKDPVKELKRIYEELGLVYTDDFDTEVARFLEKNRDYRKNRYQLSGDEEKRIMSNPAFDRYFS
jgi:hypothetical protein